MAGTEPKLSNHSASLIVAFAFGSKLGLRITASICCRSMTRTHLPTGYGFLVRPPRGGCRIYSPGSSCSICWRGWWSITVPPPNFSNHSASLIASGQGLCHGGGHSPGSVWGSA